MDHLQSIFIAEAQELIADLEKALLAFEKDLNNKNSVQEIFRVMHTLKGSASMFGFEMLSSLTHDLETIYDGIREGDVKPTLDILEVTLRSVDHLKQIIQDANLERNENAAEHRELLVAIKGILNGSEKAKGLSGSSEAPSEEEYCTYYIYCKPGAALLKNGSNPLYLVDDLVSLGHAVVIPHFDQVPELNNLVADTCYASFEVILVTGKNITDIKEVFLFVEGGCEISIEKLSEGNLLSVPAFVKTLNHSLDKIPFGLEIIRTISNSVKAAKDESRSIGMATQTRQESTTSIRVSSDKLDELMNLVSELVTSQARLSLLAEKNGIPEFIGLSENMEKITRRLRDNAFSICLIPVETLAIRFQRLVRDLSLELNKEIQFITEGTDTELDKSIIEKITDPILHILRNAIDHGIELPGERVKKGKRKQGTILFKAFYSGTHVHIQIKDDGRGIDPEKIKAKALSKGMIGEDAVLSEKEIAELVFSAGFSTAESITDVSGRGVGMDIVRRNIEAIHGEVRMTSKVDEGTTITIRLPLTLSIMDGLLVRIGSSDYIVPLAAVDKCYELPTRNIRREHAQKIVLDGEQVPVFNLQEIFSELTEKSEVTPIIKIKYDEFPVGITVDSIIGEYQAVLKPLGELYRGRDEYSGATILGDGSVALVFDTDKLIRQLRQVQVHLQQA